LTKKEEQQKKKDQTTKKKRKHIKDGLKDYFADLYIMFKT
jgi:hypothetical protein